MLAEADTIEQCREQGRAEAQRLTGAWHPSQGYIITDSPSPCLGWEEFAEDSKKTGVASCPSHLESRPCEGGQKVLGV